MHKKNKNLMRTFTVSSQEDSQKYYRWQSFGPTDDRTEELWVDLSSLHKSQVQIHSILSSTHRKAAVRQTHTFTAVVYRTNVV